MASPVNYDADSMLLFESRNDSKLPAMKVPKLLNLRQGGLEVETLKAMVRKGRSVMLSNHRSVPHLQNRPSDSPRLLPKKEAERFVPKIDNEKYEREFREIEERRQLKQKELLKSIMKLSKSTGRRAAAAAQKSRRPPAPEKRPAQTRVNYVAPKAEVSLNPALECVVSLARIAPVPQSIINLVKTESESKEEPLAPIPLKEQTFDNVTEKSPISRVALNMNTSPTGSPTTSVPPPMLPPILKRGSGEFASARAVSLKRVRLDPKYTHLPVRPYHRAHESASFDRTKATPEDPKPESVLLPRKRKFSFAVKWETHRLEGLSIAQHNPALMNEKRIQGFMLVDELRVLIDKVFQIRFILQRGIKLKIADVLKQMPLTSRTSLNTKLEELISYLHMTGLMLLQEYQKSSETIGIESIAETLVERTVTNETRNFREVLEILGSAYDFLKDCTSAYKLMLQSPERPGFSLDEFHRLEYLVSRARFLVSHLEEEYKENEYSLENKGRVEKFIKNQFDATVGASDTMDSSKTRVFERLAHRMSARDLKAPPAPMPKKEKSKHRHKEKVDKIQEDGLPSKAERLKTFIDSCLHKIYPRRSEVPTSTNTIIRKDLLIDKHTRNKQFLGETLEVLRKCMLSDSPLLRADINNLMKQFKEEYIKTQKRIDNAQRLRHTPNSDDEEEKDFLNKFA